MRNKRPIHSRAFVNAVRLNWAPVVVWALFLGFASLLGGNRETLYGGTGEGAGGPGPGVIPPGFTEFRLETRDALRGNIVNVGVFVVVKSPLSEVSIAINFDEEDLRLLGVSQPTVVDNGQNNVTQSIDFDNNNDQPGNQAGEGWVHLQLKTANHQDNLDLAVDEVILLFRLQFRVLGGAKDGLSPLVFQDIPIRVLERLVFLRNSVTESTVDMEQLEPQPLSSEGLSNGSLNIIGEVGFFMRGDANYSLDRDISDPIMTLRHIFETQSTLPCEDSADSNDDGDIDVSDAVFTLINLFAAGAPFPAPEEYGPDPTEDALDCEAGGLSH